MGNLRPYQPFPSPPGRSWRLFSAIAALPFLPLFFLAAPVEGVNPNAFFAPLPLSQVKFWALQTQGLEKPGVVDALAESHYDLLVVEPTRTYGEDGFNTKAMVEELKATRSHDSVHRKLVLAYLQIGEAQNGRWYWPQPNGKDYPVVFWDPFWKDIVIYGKLRPPTEDRDYASAMDEVMRDDFDGVYLEGVETFEDAKSRVYAQKQGVDAAEEMLRFMREIKEFGKKRNPNFLVLQKGGASLIEKRLDLPEVIDGIVQEGIWFTAVPDAGETKWEDPRGYDHPQDISDTGEMIESLQPFVANGVPVFTLDYAVRWANAAYHSAKAGHFVEYCTRPSLNHLTTTPPPFYPSDHP